MFIVIFVLIIPSWNIFLVVISASSAQDTFDKRKWGRKNSFKLVPKKRVWTAVVGLAKNIILTAYTFSTNSNNYINKMELIFGLVELILSKFYRLLVDFFYRFLLCWVFFFDCVLSFSFIFFFSSFFLFFSFSLFVFFV